MSKIGRATTPDVAMPSTACILQDRLSLRPIPAFDLNAAYRVLRKEKMNLRVMLGYRRDEWKWSDSGGTYVYSTFGFRDDIERHPFDLDSKPYEICCQWVRSTADMLNM